MDARPTPPPPAHVGFAAGVPAQALAGMPGMLPGLPGAMRPGGTQPVAAPPAPVPAAAPKVSPTEALAARTGALVNEVDFPGFVAQLVHGTFDAIVDASIRQMESYASLVAAVAKTTEQFTEENVTENQARDWVAQKYAADVTVLLPRGSDDAQRGPLRAPRAEGLAPAWRAGYGVGDQELDSELLESVVLPKARQQIGA